MNEGDVIETKLRINRIRQPLSCRCRVKFSTHSDQPCRNLSHLYFWMIRSFTDPACVYLQHFRCAVPCRLFAFTKLFSTLITIFFIWTKFPIRPVCFKIKSIENSMEGQRSFRGFRSRNGSKLPNDQQRSTNTEREALGEDAGSPGGFW